MGVRLVGGDHHMWTLRTQWTHLCFLPPSSPCFYFSPLWICFKDALNMALNWTMLDNKRNFVPLPNEMTITTIDSGVDLSLTIPNAPPSTSALAGGSGGVSKLKATGKASVTDKRVRLAQSMLQECEMLIILPPLCSSSSPAAPGRPSTHYLSLYMPFSPPTLFSRRSDRTTSLST